MTVSLSQTKGRTIADVVRWMVHQGFCIVSSKLVNPIASEIELNPVGQPVKVSGANHVFVQDGDEANATGLVMYDKKIIIRANATTDELYPILKRGPALIDEDALPSNDINGDAFTVSTLVTAYAALNIRVQQEPAKTSTQTN